MTTAITDLAMGMDFRRPEYRREVFLRFYEFHLRYRSHPGCVYYVMPSLRWQMGWDTEEALWFAFLNGCTQHPATSLILHRRFPRPSDTPAMTAWFEEQFTRLPFDTDRRHQKTDFSKAATAYAEMTKGGQKEFWNRAAEGGWDGVWAAATSIPSFGRLAAFSYSEYLRIMGTPVECPTLLLDDRSGSRSHRNGLCKVLGRDDLDWHASNPGFDGIYPGETLEWLEDEAATLLEEARARTAGKPYAGDVGYFTLESALCTYKSWHRPNRRYPNVYNDLLYDRLKLVEAKWPDEDFSPLWAARGTSIPPWLRLEDNPHDPGCVPLKQNWYLTTGEVPCMYREWPCFYSSFDRKVESGEFGTWSRGSTRTRSGRKSEGRS